MSRRLFAGVVLGGWVVCVAGCQRPQPPTPSTPDASSVASVDAAPSALPSSSLATSRRLDGCWGIDLPTTPQLRVERLAKRCAQGMSALAPASTLAVPPGGVDWTTPTIKAGSCVRVIAAMNGGVEVSVLDTQGHTLASDRDPAFALAPLRGPLCVATDGPLKVHVTPVAADGVTSIGVWASLP